MTQRRAEISDASSIAALSIEVWLGTYLKRGINGFFADYVLSEFTTAKVETIIADPSEYILVSENEDGIDGFIRVSFGSEGPVDGCSDTEISTFYIQPRHHGKGIGKALLRAASDHCKDQGITSVWLTTNSENTPAIEFYHRQGFRQIGETHFRLKDQAYLNNVYVYALD
ncbi:GNAT family N-acetyltransferase [Cochlodiniinecator piscidefendens]|uniref:GNAT family N-acetyltransferase n=1 Tax=Cochlodiniinecator piscidefendens TaxID=2715756 RepID=UPI001407DCE9|nr:GNAT family N-acetyltransferase [Cochlodiniinecator piscidefendens]